MVTKCQKNCLDLTGKAKWWWYYSCPLFTHFKSIKHWCLNSLLWMFLFWLKTSASDANTIYHQVKPPSVNVWHHLPINSVLFDITNQIFHWYSWKINDMVEHYPWEITGHDIVTFQTDFLHCDMQKLLLILPLILWQEKYCYWYCHWYCWFLNHCYCYCHWKFEGLTIAIAIALKILPLLMSAQNLLISFLIFIKFLVQPV